MEGAEVAAMPERNPIGPRVRAIRESRALSVEQLADRAGLRVELINRVEAGSIMPSLAPLMRVARALGVRFGAFFDDQEHLGPVITRSDERPRVARFSGKDRPGRGELDFYSLAANKAGRHVEPFIVNIHPSSARTPKLSAHEGEEFIYVLTGEVEVNYGRETHRLRAGDSIYYDSLVPHDVHADAEATVLACVYAHS
jgi:transcriptional regulator with XRE-family HTH domain